MAGGSKGKVAAGRRVEAYEGMEPAARCEDLGEELSRVSHSRKRVVVLLWVCAAILVAIAVIVVMVWKRF